MNILFFGSSNYCVLLLETLVKNFIVVAVVTQPDKPVGRKQVLTPTLIKQFALSHNIKVLTPSNRNRLLSLKDEIATLAPDLAVVADFGLIIPKEIFTLPRYQTLNVHFSKLPALRGPSPVQYTILYDEKSAWISVVIMDEGIDTGDIIWQKEVPLTGTETSDTLYKKLFNITVLELPGIISLFAQNKLNPIKQNHSQATYTKHLTREDGYIPVDLLGFALKGINPPKEQLTKWLLFNDLSNQPTTHNPQPTTIIERALRAFTPWPGIWTEITIRPTGSDKNTSDGVRSTPPRWRNQAKKRLKILKAHLEDNKLVLDTVQLEGKNPVSWQQFLEGYPDTILSAIS